MAPERHRSCASRLYFVSCLVRRRCGFRAEAAGLFEEGTKSVRQLAFLKAFSARVIAGDVLVTDEIKVTNPKTKEFVSLLKSHTDAEKVLVISTAFDEATYKAARNVRPAQLHTASEVNTEQLLAFQKIIVTNEALARLAERLA